MLDILQKKSENILARDKMRLRGIDFTSSFFVQMLRKAHIKGGVSVGDRRKSWDVLKTIEFLEKSVSLSAPILDVGAFASEVLCILDRLNFTDLTGIDLNPELKKMPKSPCIRYHIGDFTQAELKEESFQAVTAISVIEHGFESDKLLGKICRLLRPGGFFIASTDYWPEKIKTEGIRPFGMDWRVFSSGELEIFVAQARRLGLRPVGDIHLRADKPTVSWMGRHYTFAWMAFQKQVEPSSRS